MHPIDICFSRAVDHALKTLSEFYGLDPSLERLIDHPARDNLILSGLETPYFSSFEPSQTVMIRIWIGHLHTKVWNDKIFNELINRVNRQSHGDDIEFIFERIIYPT